MPFSVIQAGANLQFVNTDGTITTLTIPSNIEMRQDVPPRWAVYGRYVILVNTPSRPLTIDATGTVRPLTPLPPRLAAVLAGVSSGTLSGTFMVRYTNIIRDAVGNIIAESDYSPTSNATTITTQALQASSIDVSPDAAVSARRLYRTTTNGAVFFQWIDLDGNILTTVQDDLSDDGLGETAGPLLGTPPRLTLIAEFRDRLFGVGDIDVDIVHYTETGFQYAWNPLNAILVPRVGSDTHGVTAIIGRREALGVGRLNRLSQIVGTGEEDTNGNADLRLIKLSDETGFLAQESVAIYNDVVYFLWFDGVYEWSDNGILCLSDGSGGHARVRSWFATDNYFDRTRFSRAFAQIDTNRKFYRLFLTDPDGALHHVEFDLINRVWFGPHKTAAFTARSAFQRLSANDVKIATIGASDGGLYAATTRAADVDLTGQPFGIDFDVDTRAFAGTSPDRLQYFGELSILGKSRPAGTLTITPSVGYLDDEGGLVLTPQEPILHNMRKGREHLRRIGTGALAQLNLRHTANDETVSALGLEIADVHEVGRR